MEETRLRPGLSVPVVTVLDPDGALIEAEQRAVVRHVVQDGYGADVVFAAGTTGEWDRVENRRPPARLCRSAPRRSPRPTPPSVRRQGRPVEAWAGITSATPRETLENLELAIAVRSRRGGAGAALDPRSRRSGALRGATTWPICSTRARRRIPVYLYDNADIAADPKVPHIRTRQVKAMSRLDFVRGIKVSAPRRVLGNYTKAAASFRERGEFGIYVGNAMLIFDICSARARAGSGVRSPSTGTATGCAAACRSGWSPARPTCCRGSGRGPGR